MTTLTHDYSDLRFLRVVNDDGVAIVLLDRPAKHNAFTSRGHHEMANIFRRLGEDDAVRSVVLAGAGTTFCAGPDRALLAALNDPTEDELRRTVMADARQMVHDAIDLDKPVVTAMHGVANGGGLAFALLADIVVVERQVSIREAHVLAGITAGDGGTLVWPAAMGLTKAKRYLLTSDPVTAEEAERLGLVTEVVERGRALDRATQYARRFAAGPQFAIRSTKRALNEWLRSSATQCFDTAWAAELVSMSTADARAAARTLAAGQGGAMPPDSHVEGVA